MSANPQIGDEAAVSGAGALSDRAAVSDGVSVSGDAGAGSHVVPESLRSIAVQVELSTGNIDPLLHEIRHALSRLLQEDATSSIDLKSIPLAPGEEERILEVLGRGEARAELAVFGTSELIETSFPGVWVITHRDVNGDVQARFIEVTRVPQILCSQAADIADGLARLGGGLGFGGTEGRRFSRD